MSSTEAMAAAITVLRVAYPGEFSDDTATFYARRLASLDPNEVVAAVDRLVNRMRFRPTVADIRLEVAEAQLELPNVAEAWALAQSGNLRDAPAPVREAAEFVGGRWAIATSENPSTLRAQFPAGLRAHARAGPAGGSGSIGRSLTLPGDPTASRLPMSPARSCRCRSCCSGNSLDQGLEPGPPNDAVKHDAIRVLKVGPSTADPKGDMLYMAAELVLVHANDDQGGNDMKGLALTAAMLTLAAIGFGGALVLSAGLSATNTPTTTTGGGHTPVTICHKPGTPAEQTLVVDDDAVPGHLGHGDYLGACQPTPPPVDYCDTLPGVQGEDEDCPVTPPHDECENIPGDQPEGYDCTPEPPVVTEPPKAECPPPNPDGSYGGQDGKPGNDRCKADPVTPPAVTTTTTPAPPTTTVTPPPVVTTPTPDAPVTQPPAAKPKPKATPKPDKPPVVKVHTKTCPAPAYMLDGKCVRDYKGKPHGVVAGSG